MTGRSQDWLVVLGEFLLSSWGHGQSCPCKPQRWEGWGQNLAPDSCIALTLSFPLFTFNFFPNALKKVRYKLQVNRVTESVYLPKVKTDHESGRRILQFSRNISVIMPPREGERRKDKQTWDFYKFFRLCSHKQVLKLIKFTEKVMDLDPVRNEIIHLEIHQFFWEKWILYMYIFTDTWHV